MTSRTGRDNRERTTTSSNQDDDRNRNRNRNRNNCNRKRDRDQSRDRNWNRDTYSSYDNRRSRGNAYQQRPWRDNHSRRNSPRSTRDRRPYSRRKPLLCMRRACACPDCPRYRPRSPSPRRARHQQRRGPRDQRNHNRAIAQSRSRSRSRGKPSKESRSRSRPSQKLLKTRSASPPSTAIKPSQDTTSERNERKKTISPKIRITSGARIGPKIITKKSNLIPEIPPFNAKETQETEEKNPQTPRSPSPIDDGEPEPEEAPFIPKDQMPKTATEFEYEVDSLVEEENESFPSVHGPA